MPKPSEPGRDDTLVDNIIGLGERSQRKSYFPELQEQLHRLERSERLFHSVFDDAFQFMGVLDPQGTLLEANRSALSFIGATAESVRGKPFWTTPWWTGEGAQERLHGQILQAAAGESIRDEVTHMAPDGSAVRIDFSLTPVRNAEGAVIFIIAEGRDITALRELEEQLRQSQKLDAIGRLAGGIAHDFNNMLGAISGSTELLRRRLKDRPDVFRLLDLVTDAASRAADLTRRLLTISRKGTSTALRPMDLHAAISETIKLLERSIDRRISITCELHAQYPVILGDASLLQSALLNLGINARDAMPDGGILHFATEDADADSPLVPAASRPLPPGNYCAVTVSDTGTGMTPEVLARLFEPFFTTKSPGRGTGLGLAMVYGTVSDHRGIIHVNSSVGNGSRFTILLPTTAREMAPVATVASAAPRGDGTILVVDDEAVLRTITAAQLQELGYRVILASDGQEALEVFAAHRSTIDAVVMDLIMPRMNGRTCFHALRALNPGLPIILMSGFDHDQALDELASCGVDGCLTKPFTSADLGRMVAAAVARRRRTA